MTLKIRFSQGESKLLNALTHVATPGIWSWKIILLKGKGLFEPRLTAALGFAWA